MEKFIKMEEFSNLLKNISVTGDKGKLKVVFWQGKKAPTLEEAQAIVGGSIECVAEIYYNEARISYDVDIIVNEEGLILGLDMNIAAFKICTIPLMGNVLVLKGKQRLQ